MFTGFRLKVRNFFKKNRRIIIFLVVIWLLVMVVNQILKRYSFEDFERTTYNEHQAIMDTGETVPEKLKQPINETIDTYFNYCNNKQYEEAYNMVLEECKRIYFPTLEDFKKYIDIVFDENKVYYLQNFSNYNDTYIYRMRIMEDLMATGLTNKDDLYFYEEKIALKENDGKISLSLRQYITSENIEEIYEDEFVKINVKSKDVFYEQEIYTVEIKNKTSNIIVMADSQENNEIILQVGTESRTTDNDNLYVVVHPNETQTFSLNFTKFYDEEKSSVGLIFNAVRILPQYSGFEELKDYELSIAKKLYSIEIPF